MIILSIRLFFLAARGMNPEGLPQLSGACLYSNPPLLLSLRVFLTPPSFGHLPYILRRKTQRRRVNSITSIAGLFNPSPRRYAPQFSPIFSCENTGEKGNTRFGNEVEFYCFVTPRHVTGHGRGGGLNA